MNNNSTELVFILDRSGSMYGLEADTIGGFNSLLADQKKAGGNVLVTTVLFNHTLEVIHDRLPIEEVPPMTEKDYTADGCTALFDAVGKTIRHIGTIHQYARPEDVPGRTLFVITTDGMENASRFYKAGEIRQMIRHQKSVQNWEFLFLGANIDASEAAEQVGIDADLAADFCADSAGIKLNFEVLSKAIDTFRSAEPLGKNWKKRIDSDYKKRSKSQKP